MKGNFFYTDENLENSIPMPEGLLKDLIMKKYNNEFIAALCIEELNVVLVELKDDPNNSDNDVWQAIFYKKITQREAKEITLDNIEEIEKDGQENYDFYKEIEGNFSFIITNAVANFILKED